MADLRNEEDLTTQAISDIEFEMVENAV